jgi:class 3 adenylate cyclase
LNVISGTTGIIDFPSNAAPGNYILTAEIGDLSVEKQFTVKEVANISVMLLEDLKMVSVINIGNTPYADSLNVTIGNETETIFVDLELGEEKRYSLRAPDGIYDVFAQIGTFSAVKQLSLTGHAVSVGSWTGVGLLEQYPLIWIFIVAILITAGIIVFMKFRNNRTYDYKARAEERAKKEMKDEDLNEISRKAFQKKQFLNLANPVVNEAQSVPTLKGNKDNCSVVSVNVKNYASLGAEARNKLNEIISTAKDRFGVLEFRGQHMLIIYSPLVTKTYKNEIIASKAAWKIRNELDKYNSKFKDKIKYNIGLNAGEMVSALLNGKLVYTNIGNGVVLAKRISDLSEGKILASQSFRQKLMRELKVNKTNMTVGNSEILEVIAMADVDRNQDKLTDIMKRSNFMRTE